MKALPFKIPFGGKSSIHVDHDQLKQFYPHYHTHEENQLTLIIQGRGIAYIGDRIIEFKPGDIFFLGRQLPHVFKSEALPGNGVESISIFFLTGFMGDKFLAIPESNNLASLLKEAARGIRVSSDKNPQISQALIEFPQAAGFDRVILLLKLLQDISQQPNEYITGPDYRRPKRQADGEKINDVFNFLTTNYDKEITLATVADVAHMSPTAFCRYFKQHTRKSYSRFLNEIRVNQACRLLQENAESISQVAYSTGFNNISNFNRQFKKITGITPSEYQKISI